MRSVLASLVALAAFPLSASAGQVAYSASFGPTAIGASASVSLPRFDGAPGVLRSAKITVAGTVAGTWRMENTSAQATTVGGYTSSQSVGALVPTQAPSGSIWAPNPAYIPSVFPLAAFDGATDFAGSSGISVPFANEMGDGSPVQSVTIYQDAGVALYAGTGTFNVALGPMIAVGPSSLPPGIVHDATVFVSGWVEVRYEFDPFPTRICNATPWSGCPCANPVGNGCPNSVDAQGGVLAASGSASLSADSLVLAGSGMPNAFALYVQGETYVHAQLPYGDGLRCITGHLVRLGAHANVGGSSQYPSGGDQPISVRGAIAAPGTRTYQAIYRDTAAYCTSSTFNATNGMIVLWSP